MLIKKYDMYKFAIYYESYATHSKSIENYYLKALLLDYFGSIRLHSVTKFIEIINSDPEGNFIFDFVEINLDEQTGLIYLHEATSPYNNKKITPEIDNLLEKEGYIQACKMGFLDYTVIAKNNFFHIILTWNKILDELPPFALLYLNDQDWYDIKPFDCQEKMGQFITEHTQ